MNAPETLQRTSIAAAASPQPMSELDRLLQRPFTPRDLLEDNNFDKIWRMAEALSSSALSIPRELKGNIGDCLAIVTQAMIWGLNPFAVAQKAHVINGKLGYEAQLVNAVVMQSGAIRGSFHYEYRGAGSALECRVGAVLAGESTITWGEFLAESSITTKNSPLWKTNPKQQLGYLQVKNFARAYCPGALLGIYTDDELADVAPFSPSQEPPRLPPASAVQLPPYADDAFAKNLPAWSKLVADGKKTAPNLLATLSTKATFSDEQKAQILSLKKAEPTQPEREPGSDDEWTGAYEKAEGVAK